MENGFRNLFFPFSILHSPFSAFTLLELLIAMTILVVILTSTYTLFRSASGAFLKGEVRSELYQQVRIIFGVAEREISSALPVPGKDRYFQGSEDRLFFICPVSEQDKADLREVGYWLSNEDQTLMRHVDTDPDFDFTTADTNEELGVHIQRLAFSYYDGEKWGNSCDSQIEQGLPKAVKMEITIGDSRGKEKSEFSTIVRIETNQ